MNWWESAPLADQGGSQPLSFSVTPKARDLTIRTVLGEAAQEPDEGQAAVAAVIMNRLKAGSYGKSLPEVVLARNQFEPWNTQEGRSRMFRYAPNSDDYQRAARNVDAILNGGEDPTGGATHFFAPKAQAALGRREPQWAKGDALDIGNHRFFAPNGRLSRAVQAAEDGAWWQNAPLADEPTGAPPQGPERPATFADRFAGEPPVATPDAPNTKLKAGLEQRASEMRPSTGRSAALGAIQGVLANFGDEAAAGVNAAIDALTGQAPDGIGTAYDRRLASGREQMREAEQVNPKSFLAGQIGGAIAVPVPGAAAMRGAGMGARMAQGAAIGAGYGAVSGAGAGETPEERALKAATGAAGGAVLGAAAPPVLGAVEAGARAAAAAARPVTSAVRGLVSPEAEAARRVATAIDRDVAAGTAELGPQGFAAARAAGEPVVVADMGGETTRRLARSAGNLSTEGWATIQKIADERFEGQADRASTFLRRLVGSNADNAETRAGLKVQAQSANRPAYAKAYADPRGQALWDEGFEQLSQAPVVQDAIRAATITGANRGTVEGFPRIQSPFIVDRATGQLTLRTDEAGNRVLPNIQFWDHVKRNLDRINTPEARTLNTALKQHLDDLVPAYRDARAGAAKFFDAEDAVTAGENFVRQNKNLSEARAALAKMGQEERELFQQGFVARLIDDIGATRDRVNVLNKIGQSPQARAKLDMVLGAGGRQKVEAFMTVEQAMDKLRGSLGNSQTVRQMVEIGLAGTSGASSLLSGDPTHLSLAAAVAGRRWIDARVARKIADMLTSNDPDVLAKGVRMVASNKRLTEAFRSMDRKLARAGAGQSGSVPALQALNPSRAEDDQGVPRPRGQ